MGILENVADPAAATGAHGALSASGGIKTAVVGGGVSFVGLISSQEFISVAGILVAVLGFLVNGYYRRKDTKTNEFYKALENQYKENQDRRAQEEHEIRMKELRGECEVPDVK